ncbi:relaxase/mobilization nuclease domain-containing protein [Helicobacter canis]|uniref:MobA/VirD2-like nuclease domain-containing protein n=1 Tax=Helicobacter canis NCTC 12740 TaxID=1357399 RepID=V8CDU6_9HELI|nr:relaxase/mobilization nuclease domain-containing protein [Helicobacter canis]ETD25583.1 hypothetical protein HMPREF2087_01411 [Helicobacter canis NCTC 12740]
MRKVVLDVTEHLLDKDESLFEYVSFKKQKQSAVPYERKAFAQFHSHIVTSKQIFSTSSHKKQVVIKNIGNMKQAHLRNALGYCLKNSSLNHNALQVLLQESIVQGIAFDQCHQALSYEQILDDWSKDFSKNPHTNEALHLVFSLDEIPSQRASEILQCAVSETMQANFADYKYVMIPHNHQNRPHIHLIINKTNIFTKKKLHFKDKAEISNFFNTLREDFAYNLLTYSQGKLDYTNEVTSKEFRENLLASKEESIRQSTSSDDGSAIIKDIEYIITQKRALDSLNIKAKTLYLRTQELEKEHRNTNIYRTNVTKKIAHIIEQGKTPTRLIEKERVLADRIVCLHNQIQDNNKQLTHLRAGIRQLVDSNENFASFTKHFNALHKKKALLSSCKGFERYLSKDLITKLNVIKNEVHYSSVALQHHFAEFSTSVLQQSRSKQRSAFALQKQLRRLHTFRDIVDSMSFDDVRSSKQKDKALSDIAELEANLHSAILARFSYLQAQTKESKSFLESFASTYTKQTLPDELYLQAFQTTLGLYQKHLYCEKELAFCKKVFDRYGIDYGLAIDTGLHNAAKHTLESLQTKALESKDLNPSNAISKESSQANTSKQEIATQSPPRTL